MAEDDVDVTMEFKQRYSYTKFQKKFHKAMLMPRPGRVVPRFAHDVPVLDSADNRIVKVSLDSGKHKTGFSFAKKNCMMLGFMNRDGQWYQFSDAEIAIPGSAILAISGNYNELENHCDTHFSRVIIDRPTMKKHVRTLATFKGQVQNNGVVKKPNAAVAEALIACIIFVAEGARFGLVKEGIHTAMCLKGKKASPFTVERCTFDYIVRSTSKKYDAAKVLRDWAKLSGVLLGDKHDNLVRFAAAVLSLALHSTK